MSSKLSASTSTTQVAPLPLISERSKVVACSGFSCRLPVRVARRSPGSQAVGAAFFALALALACVVALAFGYGDGEAEALGLGLAEAAADSEGLGEPDGVGEADGVGATKADGVGVTGAGAVTGGGAGSAETAFPVLLPPSARAITTATSSTALARTRARRTQ